MVELAGVLTLVGVLLWTGGGRSVARVTATAVVRAEADPAAVLDLLAVAVESGADLPRALTVVGAALDGPSGAALGRVASALLLGATWSAAWSEAPAPLHPARDALGPAWSGGASAVPALRAVAVELRQGRRRRAREAAARLGVRLVVPLGVCFLPSFVLVGVVPVLMSLAGRMG